MNKKNTSEERLNVLIPKSLKKRYKIFCLENDFKFSKRIRSLIENDLNEKGKK